MAKSVPAMNLYWTATLQMSVAVNKLQKIQQSDRRSIQSAEFQGECTRLVSRIQPPTKREIQSQSPLLLLLQDNGQKSVFVAHNDFTVKFDL